MLRLYKIIGCVLLMLGFLAFRPHLSLAQCSITNLQPSYCSDDASITLAGGTNYYGPGVSGSNFAPGVAGIGTHTIYSATSLATSYSVSTAGSYSPDATAGTPVSFILSPNENSGTIALGFTFNFFGTNYTDLVVNANGYVSFGGGISSSTSQVLPDPTAPNNLIAGAWDDLDILVGGNVTSAVSGAAPQRKFLINFVNVRYATGPQTVSFQIQLHESTNIIEIHSGNIQDNGGSGITQGIENSTGSVGYALPGRNNANWTASSDYVAFIPTCVDIKKVSITAPPLNNLTVTAPTAICPGTGATVTIAASQSGVLYRLQRVSDNLVLSSFYPGTGSNLIINSDPLAASTNIKVYATNATTGCDNDLLTTVTVAPSRTAPVISTQPMNRAICQGTNTTFTVATGATTTPNYQWQFSNDGGITYVNLLNVSIYSGVTTATLTLTATPFAANGNLYRVIVGGACSPSVTSNAALLTVYRNATIISQPATTTICEDGTAQFTVLAIGAGLTYQWREGGTPITDDAIHTGTTSAILTLTNVPGTFDGNQYDVVVTGTCSPATSGLATLNINEKPEVTAQPPNRTICQGVNTTFTVNAGVTTTPNYQWQFSTNGGVSYTSLTNTGIYSGVTTATLSLTATPLANNGYLYRVLVGGICSPSVTSNSGLLTVNQNAGITTQPATASICENATVQFSVVAVGSGLTYQWRENGTPITNGGVYSGATTSTLTLTTVPGTLDGRQYDVVITGTCSPVTSAAAILNVNEATEITVQPPSSTICQGANTTFTADAGVTGSPTYQWQVSSNGGVSYTDLADAGVYSGVTTAILALTAVPPVNNGYLYRVLVAGTCGPVVTSNGALLTVNQNAGITTQPAAPTICEDGTAQFSVVAVGTGLTYAWREDGVPITNGGVYSGATSSILTLTTVPSAYNGRQYDVVITGTCSPVTSTAANLNVNQKPEVTGQPPNRTICQGVNTTFTVNPGVTTSPTYQWQRSTNGGVSYSNLSNSGIYSGVTTATLTLTATTLVNNGYLFRVVVSGTCTPPATSNAGLLRVNQNAGITTQPAASTICEDGTVQFSVVAVGAGLTYQWRENGTPITDDAIHTGATSTILTLTNVPGTFDGNTYDVVVTGTCLPTTSAVAILNVNLKPEITAQPATSVICQGANTTFTVNAGATTTPNYQWQVSTNGGVSYTNLADAGIYSGVTTATLTLTVTPPTNNGYLYRALIGGTCSPGVASDAALLTVNQDAGITTQPATTTICEDTTVQFSVVAVGAGLTYQWREGGTPITNGGVYGGATTSILTLTNVPSTFNARQYDVVITGTCAPVTSAAATLNVNQKPEITTQPPNRTICQGANTTFTVNAGVTTTPNYQWQVSTNGGVSYTNLTNAGIYSGVTLATLTLTVPPVANNGNLYRVLVGGVCSPVVTSNVGLLTINTSPVIVSQPAPQSICEGSTISFSVGATGTGLTYQWQENGVNITNGGVYSGATSSTLTLTSVPNGYNGRNYGVNLTAACGALTSSTALLTVNKVPNALAADASVCSGQTTNISITNPNAVPSTTFSWTIQSATNVSGAAGGSGNLIAQTLTSTDGFNPGIITYLIQPVAAGCIGTPYAVSVSVNPIPNAAASPQTICSGTSTSIAITNPNSVIGTTFNWIVFSTTNVTGALAGSGSVISQVLSATDGISTGTATYRITPVAGGCTGTSIDVTVTVSPKPVITNSSTSLIQEICSNTLLNFLPTSSITGTTFTWTSNIIGTLSGVSASGAGAITDTPINTTSSSAVIIYNIVPAISGCNGSAVNFVVTVRPVPTASAAPQTICSGTSTSVAITNPNAVAGTTYTWTAAATNVGGASGGAGSVISQLLTNTDGLTNGTVIYTITPSANGCPGPSFSVTVTVKPVPVVTNSAPSLSQQICSLEALNFTPTASITGTTFTWTGTISGPINPGTVTTSGSGNIVDTPENTGNINGTVTYRITPAINGCGGLPVDLVVTVKPLPSASAAPVIICSGQTALVNILPAPQNLAGTSYDWTVNPSANISGALNGNGSTISQVLTTTNASTGTVIYSITPMANGCAGPVTTVTVTVNPIATVNAGADYSVCEPATIPLSGTLGGSASTATWTIFSGSGTISSTSISGSTVTALYTVDPADIDNTVTFDLTTDDPDAGGPCGIISDRLVVAVHRQAGLTLPADYVVCEPGSINLTGMLSGSATSGSWSVVSGNGSVSASSVTGLNVTSIYTVASSDVNTSLRFRLTTNDPDGSGPCLAQSDDIDIFVNKSARINAGSDGQVCEDQTINLAAVSGGSTSSVLWSGGSGAAQFSPVNNVNSTYTLTPADISAGGISLFITTNDPDGAGPCLAVTDGRTIGVNKLPPVYLAGLENVYAENSGIDNLDGFPLGGVFSGPGIVAGTNMFNPSNAGFGLVTIRYTYVDPVTACSNFVEKSTIVNPVTDVDFHILEDDRVNSSGNPMICANQNDLTLVGLPPITDGKDPTKFRGISPELVSRVTYDGIDWKLNTNGLLAGTYKLQYIFTNQSNATDTLTRDLIVFSAPQAVIDLGNKCIDDIVTFAESSNIPNNLSNGNIISWNWLFDEGSNGSTGPVAEPQYRYLEAGPKNVSLEVVTDQACRSKIVKTIVIGKKPKADFVWSSFCKGDNTKFSDRSVSIYGLIDSYTWDFGDGQTAAIQNPTHTYANFAQYAVTLSVSTDAGCFSDTTKQVYIQDLETPSEVAPYSINFENGPETWVAVTDAGDPNNSWMFGLPSGDLINTANSGTNAFWTGRNSGAYFNNEKSYVIGPCLNMTGLKRPMISLNYWVEVQEGFDGAVVQYSVNGGADWLTIGDAEGGGIDWYNSRNLPGQPGGQSNFAWSDSISSWTNGRYNLDQILPQLRDTVIFRIAFGSNDDNESIRPNRNGFAFDDIYIGEKTRNVLVEHFANVGSTASNAAAEYIAEKYVEQFEDKDSSDFISVEYHIPNGGTDRLNADNPQDPIARALLYSVSQPATTIMDGIQNDYFNGFTGNITLEELDWRALEDPTFEIDIDTIEDTGTTNTQIRLAIKYTYIDSLKTLDNRVTMQAALVERGIGQNGPVVRKLLLNSEGKTVDRSWSRGDFELSNVQYEMDVPIVNPDSLFIVAFVQDNLTGAQESKRILQSRIIKSNRKVGINITGIEDNPVTGELKALSVYPNPASNELNLMVPIILLRQYTWKMIDQRGVTVLDGDLMQDFSNGPQQIDVSHLSNGIYFMSIQTGEKSIVYKKIAIMNRN